MKPKTRRNARQFALQAIYQWQHTANSANEIITYLQESDDFKDVEVEYFKELVYGVLNHVQELDKQFEKYLDRKITELNPVELAVLRLATYELIYRIDVPYKVVINEALELTKIYGSVEGFKYVNGVLDKIAKEIRKIEIKGA